MEQAHIYVLHHFADKWSLPRELVVAIARIESNGNRWAHRTEPGYRWLWDVRREKRFECTQQLAERRQPAPGFTAPPGITAASEWIAQQTSWGLLQVMGAVARENGFQLPLPALTEPVHCADIGCRHLARLRDRYREKHGWLGVLSAWNTGNPESQTGARYARKVATAGASCALEVSA